MVIRFKFKSSSGVKFYLPVQVQLKREVIDQKKITGPQNTQFIERGKIIDSLCNKLREKRPCTS